MYKKNKNVFSRSRKIMMLVIATVFVGLVVSVVCIGTLEQKKSNLNSPFVMNTVASVDGVSGDAISEWDLDVDDMYNLHDFNLVAQRNGETGSPGWILEDINKDGTVDIDDLEIIASEYQFDLGTSNPVSVSDPPPLRVGGITNISIDPPSQTVGPSETFDVDVYCDPGQPIRAYQFSLSFNPSFIQCNSVTEGNIFSGFSSYFGYVSIDNVAGDVKLVYNAIMGAGNVTGSGTFAIISFTAQSSTGLSDLDLYNVKIENETVPVPINIYDGIVQVEADEPDTTITSLDDYYNSAPSIGGTATDQSFGGIDKVEMRIQRDSDSYYWTGSTWQSTSTWFDAATGLSGWSNVSWTASNLPTWEDGVYYYLEARAYDDVGNIDSSPASDSFTYDISDPSASIENIPDYVNYLPDIKGHATDGIELDYVEIQVTDGTNYWDGSAWTTTPTWVTITGLSSTSDTWDLNDPTTYTDGQLYNIYAKATDKAGNKETTAHDSFTYDVSNPSITNIGVTFSDPIDTDPTLGWENITCTVTDTTSGVNEVYINVTYGVTTTNVSMTDGGGGVYYYNTTFTDIGDYSYIIWADDNTINSATSSSNTFEIPPNYDVKFLVDRMIDISDPNAVSLIFGSPVTAGSIREDVNNDGFIDISDLNQVCLHFGESW